MTYEVGKVYLWTCFSKRRVVRLVEHRTGDQCIVETLPDVEPASMNTDGLGRCYWALGDELSLEIDVEEFL